MRSSEEDLIVRGEVVRELQDRGDQGSIFEIDVPTQRGQDRAGNDVEVSGRSVLGWPSKKMVDCGIEIEAGDQVKLIIRPTQQRPDFKFTIIYRETTKHELASVG